MVVVVVAGGGAAGLEGDETRAAALASLPRQLISASCWRLAERKYAPGGLALESCCSTSTEISDLNSEFTLGCSHLLVLRWNAINENVCNLFRNADDIKHYLDCHCEVVQ